MTLDLKPVLDLEPVESRTLDLTPVDDVNDIPLVDAQPAEDPRINQRALAGEQAAMATLDFMGLPFRLDWEGANQDRQMAETSRLIDVANRVGYEQWLPSGDGKLTPTRIPGTLEKRARELEAQEPAQGTPQFEELKNLTREIMLGQEELRKARFNYPGDTEEVAARFAENQRFSGALAQPEAFVNRLGLQALPAAGALAGARLMTVKGAEGLSRLAPLVGGFLGGATAGAGQEVVLQATESDEETQARQEQSEREGLTTGGRLADLAGMSVLFRPSISQLQNAFRGNPEAVRELVMGTGVGMGFAGAGALTEGRLPTSKDILTGGIEGAIFNTPTKLTQRLMAPSAGRQRELAGREARANLQDVMSRGEPVMPTVSANRSILESGLNKPLSREEALIVATQGLDALQPRESGTLEAGYREAVIIPDPPARVESGDVATSDPRKLSLEEIRSEGTEPTDPNRQLGPGAANIEEFGPQKTVAAYNERVDAQRLERGLQPLMSEARKADQITWDNAERRIEADPELPRRLTDDIMEGRKTSVTDEEQTTLLWRMVDLQTKREAALERATNPEVPEAEQIENTAIYERLEADLQQTEEANRKIGTQSGRALRIRQLIANDDFTPNTMERKARLAKGEPLTAEEAQHERAESVRIQKSEADRVTRTAAVDEAQSVEAATEAVRQEAAPTYSERFRKWAESRLTEFDARAEEAHRELRELMGFTSANPIQPKAIAAIFHIAKAKIARAGYDLARFTADLVGELGEQVRPFIKPAWDRATKFFESNTGQKPPSAKVQAKQAAAATEAVGTEDGIKAIVAEGTKLEDFGPQIKRLAKEYIQSGVNTVEGLQTKLHEFFAPLFPDVTPRQLRDAFSDYGKVKPATTDPLKVTEAQLRSDAQKLSTLENLMKKEAGLRTGQQRVPQSDRSRQLTKKINELKKELGIVDGDPATRLRSALEAMETRTRNRIKDLRFEIARGERIVRQKGAQPTSPELEALKAELATVQAEHDSIFGKREMTPEQRLKAAIAAAERAEQTAVAELDNARKGIFIKPVAKEGMKSTELQAIRARTTAAREETKLLKQIADPPLSDAQKALDRAMVARERWEQALAGEIAPAKRVPQEALTQLEEDARAEIAAMREMAAQMRRDAKPKADPEKAKEEATVKALEKSAAEYERRVNEADFAGRGRTQTADTQRVAKARAVRDAARKAFDTAKEAAAPPAKSADEIAIQAYKTRTARRIADLQERTAKADFEPRTRKTLDVSKDAEAVRLKAEADTAKRDFEKRRFEWERAKRSKVRKGWDAIMETAAASRSLITSADVSAPLRQGGFLLLGDLVTNPKRAAKQIGTMFRQLVSERAFDRAQAQISLRPNAPLYESSKLYLADLNGRLSAREEAMRSTLAERIPGVGRIVRASNRAYTGFLNRQRVDAFDAMVESAGGKDAITPEGAKILADAVNALTGRGTAFGAEKMADMAAKYLFSPRFLVSRFQTVLGEPIWNARRKGGATERKIIAAQYVKFAAGLSALMGLAKLAGASIELDPRSSDFMKARFGNTRIDLMAGLQQVTRLIAQSLPVVGKVKTVKGEMKDTTAATYGNFVRGKMAPIPATLLNLKAGKNIVGEPVTPLSALRDVTVPISYQEVPALYREHGALKGTLLEALNLIGAGVSNYEPRTK